VEAGKWQIYFQIDQILKEIKRLVEGGKMTKATDKNVASNKTVVKR
jgi:hypothetical protein